MAIALSGSLVITGSIFATQGITGSFSGNATSASYADTLQGLGSASFAPAATFNTVSQSFATTSGSLSTRVTNLESTSSTVSSSFASTSGSIAGRVTLIEGQYATTGSNTFTGPQYVSQASNAISFTSTASLYTDGGLRVSKDSFVSGTAYFNNVVVYGTSSIQYITSSQVNFGTNIITVNTDTPAVRFGGLSVFDSGSTGLTGSIFWDSEKNHWIYSNPSGSSYNSAMLMNGPRNTGSLGNEQGTLNNYVMKGQGGDHITSSQIIDDGTTVSIPGNLQVTGSLVGSSTAAFSDTVTISKAAAISSLIIKSSSSTTGLWLYLNGLNATLSNQDNGSLAFQTNGTDRLTISSTGAATFSSSVTASGNLNLQGAVTRNINFYDSSNTNINAQIQYDQISSNSGQLFFGTNNAGTFATRMTITNAGNVGIGTTSPTVLFTIGKIGTANQLGFYDGATAKGFIGISAGTSDIIATDALNDMVIRPSSAGNLLFAIGGTERMRVSNGGNVGIGTSSPNSLFVVNGGDADFRRESANSRILVTAPGVANTVLGFNNSGSTTTGVTNNTGYIGVLQAYPLVFITDSVERLRITSTGNVGIGTSNPLADLQVSRTGEVVIAMGNNGSITSGNRGTLAWYNSADSTVAIIRATAVTDNVGTQLEFYTRPAAGSLAQKMILNSSGRLLVGGGVTDNGASIQTNGDIRADYSSAIYLEINGGSTGDYRKGFSGVNQQTGVARGLHIFNYDPDSSQGIKFYGGTYAAKVRFGGFDNGGNFFVNSTDSAEGYKLYVNGTVGITGAATFSNNISNSGNLITYKSGGGGTPKQVVVGQTTAAASGVAKKIAYVGFTHSVRVYVWANQSTANGSSAIADIVTLYGSSNGGTVMEANFGNVTDISISYDNGGSPAYTINVTLTYSGAAPTINYVVEGINHDNSIYTIA